MKLIKNKFDTLDQPELSNKNIDNNNLADNFNDIILSAAEETIPKTLNNKKSLPGWNENYQVTMKKAKNAKNIYKRHRTLIKQVLKLNKL